MIKVTLKSIAGTISEWTFMTLEEALAWIDAQSFSIDVIGYTLETEVGE